MFPNFSFGSIAFTPGVRPSIRERIIVVYEDFAKDPMLPDSNEFPEFEEIFGINSSLNMYIPLPKSNQTLFLTPLPDGNILKITRYLLQESKPALWGIRGVAAPGLKPVACLSLTCKRLWHLTTNPAVFTWQLETTYEWQSHLYPGVEWDLHMLERFLLYEMQANALREATGVCLDAFASRIDRDATQGIIQSSMRIIQYLEGLYDDSPDYHELEWVPFPWASRVYFVAPLFSNAFIKKNGAQA